MPPDALQLEAEWLAVRAMFMGKVQANIAGLSASRAEMVLAAMPFTTQAAMD